MQNESQAHKPTPEEIARTAYFLWEKNGRPEGHDVKHWLEAESLLTVTMRQELKSVSLLPTPENVLSPKHGRRGLRHRNNHAANRAAAVASGE